MQCGGAGENDEVHHDVRQEHADADIPGGVSELRLARRHALPHEDPPAATCSSMEWLVCQKNM
jgi:hypothetical protein